MPAHHTPTQAHFVDMTGLIFGRWTVISYAGNKHWVCRCECDGKEKIISGKDLRRGKSKSCGCLSNYVRRSTFRDFRTVRFNPKPKHGEASNKRNKRNKRPEHMVYHGIIQRCHNPKAQAYARYGARGIAVCDRWRESFQNFIADIGPRPSAKHSIDRIDNDGNYEPGNCRWATRTQQSRNTRRNRKLTHNGETLCVAEWSERTGIDGSTIRARIRAGWSVGESLSKPTRILGTLNH